MSELRDQIKNAETWIVDKDIFGRSIPAIYHWKFSFADREFSSMALHASFPSGQEALLDMCKTAFELGRKI